MRNPLKQQESMEVKKQHTFSDFALKIAASVIAAVIIGMGAAGATFLSDKVSKEEYEKQCKIIEEKQCALQDQLNNQLLVNSAMLEALNGIKVDVQEVKTNTEWLMRENNNER